MNPENKDKNFISFPLYLMRDFFTDREGTMNRILQAGIVNYAQLLNKINPNLEKAVRQAIYNHERSRGKLPKHLLKELDDYLNGGILDDTGFDQEIITDYVKEIAEKIKEDSEEFLPELILWGNIHNVLRSFKLNGNTGVILKSGRKLISQAPAKDCWISMNINTVWDFYKNVKDQYSCVQFACYIALKSILGKKTYVKTNKQLIIARMAGYINHEQIKPKPAVKELLNRYSERYQFEKLMINMQLKWNMSIYSYRTRGLFISNSKVMDSDKLIKEVETKRREKNQRDLLKQRKREAREKAYRELNLNQPEKNYPIKDEVFDY